MQKSAALALARRWASTASASAEAARAAAKANRPVSPHLTIYSKQLTFNMSALHRITAVMHVGVTYGFGLGFLLLPAYFSSDRLASAVSTVPKPVTLAAKAVLAGPFMYHNINGLRHLLWDTTRGLSVTGVYRLGYAVQALTAASTAALCYQ